jgi:hypothetical protein
MDLHPCTPAAADLQQNKVVVLLSGRFAGKKAVIVKNFDDGTSSRPYGHAIVVGLQKEPRKAGALVNRDLQALHQLLHPCQPSQLQKAGAAAAMCWHGYRTIFPPS